MTKERIEKLYGVDVIALVGTDVYLTHSKEETMFTDVSGHNCIRTNIYTGKVTVTNRDTENEVTNYECIDCKIFIYDMVTKEITNY